MTPFVVLAALALAARVGPGTVLLPLDREVPALS